VRKSGALCNGDVLLFVCLFVRFSVTISEVCEVMCQVAATSGEWGLP